MRKDKQKKLWLAKLAKMDGGKKIKIALDLSKTVRRIYAEGIGTRAIA